MFSKFIGFIVDLLFLLVFMTIVTIILIFHFLFISIDFILEKIVSFLTTPRL